MLDAIPLGLLCVMGVVLHSSSCARLSLTAAMCAAGTLRWVVRQAGCIGSQLWAGRELTQVAGACAVGYGWLCCGWMGWGHLTVYLRAEESLLRHSVHVC